MIRVEEKVPAFGYRFPLWENVSNGWRATAVAYMTRESVDFIENTNGRWYTLLQLKNALVHG